MKQQTEREKRQAEREKKEQQTQLEMVTKRYMEHKKQLESVKREMEKQMLTLQDV